MGTGGHGKVVLDCAEKQYKNISFLTNDLNANSIGNYPILFEQNTTPEYILKNFDQMIVAIGNNNARLRLSLKYISLGMKLATIIHPRAVVNTGSIIEHDCILEDGVHISPNAVMGGTVSIGKKSWVCVGCSIANNVKIGEDVVVGAGSVVLKEVPNNVLVAGIPAVIKKNNGGKAAGT